MLRIAFRDFPGRFNPDKLLALLKTRFEVQEVETDPEYVIHSVFGYSFLSEPEEAIRIAFIGENVRPDFNLSDYSFGFDWLEFDDRYYRAPNYILYPSFKSVIGGTPPLLRIPFGERTFCNFLYSNPNAHPMRDILFDRLQRIGRVDSPGAHRRNMSSLAVPAYKSNWEEVAVEWQSNYRFSISVENSSTPGYSTEKVVNALAAGTIPIYFGDPVLHRIFNPDRMINIHLTGLDNALKRVQEINNNSELFAEVLRQPNFTNGKTPSNLSEEFILDAFERIFSQPIEVAIRRSRGSWGKRYEKRLLQALGPRSTRFRLPFSRNR